MTDADYDRFAEELTTLCWRHGIRVEVDETTGFHVLVPGFYPNYRYVVGHDTIAGLAIKMLALVLGEPSEPDGPEVA